MCWVEKQLAQRKGLKFYQTRCNAIILYDTLPAYCTSNVVVYARKKMCRLDHHRRFPSKIIERKIWIQKSLEASKTPNESRQNPKPNYQETERPVGGQESTKGTEKSIVFDHEDVKHSTSTGRPVFGSESAKSCVLIQKLKKIKQER